VSELGDLFKYWSQSLGAFLGFGLELAARHRGTAV
jgi:hypothetical protein